MRLAKRLTDEAGSASLEFLTAGTLLLVPIVYLIVAVSTIQSATFAVEAGARQAARVFVESSATDDASARAQTAVAFAFADAGLEPESARLDVTCAPVATDCLARESVVTVVVSTRVTLPLVPEALTSAVPLSVPVQATASQQVSRFGGLP